MGKRFGLVHDREYKIPLHDWNEERRQYWADARQAAMEPSRFPNGLACPTCGGHLYDTGQVLTQSPTMMRVKCQNCSYKGERFE